MRREHAANNKPAQKYLVDAQRASPSLAVNSSALEESSEGATARPTPSAMTEAAVVISQTKEEEEEDASFSAFIIWFPQRMQSGGRRGK